jgi:uncharacterized protein (TIGR02118 family)
VQPDDERSDSGYKLTRVVRFADRSDPVARERWAAIESNHAPSVQGLVRCVQSHVIGPLPREADLQNVYSENAQTSFDGYSSYWFTDAAACERAIATPEWRALTDVTDELVEGRTMTAPIRECTIIERADPGPYKVVWIVRFKSGMEKDQGHRYWEHVHGPIVRDAGIDRYVQNHVADRIRIVGHEPDYDGFSECWFADERGFIDALATPHWRRLHEDRHQIFAMSEMWCAALSEVPIV